MRKWFYCILTLLAIPILSYGGFGGEDVGKLQPVQVVTVKSHPTGVQLLTDTGDRGFGTQIADAIQQMKETSKSRVFLDTADYLLLEPGTQIWLNRLKDYLRPSCSLCYVTDDVDLKEVAEYLMLHEPELTLAEYEAGERQLPCLISEEGRMKLVRP